MTDVLQIDGTDVLQADVTGVSQADGTGVLQADVTDTLHADVTGVLQAEVMLKSGSTTRHLDCVSSRDPRQAFPFIALLNHSNVATVELILHSQLPEFVWIGFECQ